MVHFLERGMRRRSSRVRRRPMSEINVTPMVDVMLVLLVIFMITAPLLTVGVQVDLPKADAAAIPGSDEPLTITIDAEGGIYLQDTPMTLSGLVPRLVAITGRNPDVRIFVRGDRSVAYGNIMAVMATLNRAGFDKVALIAESPHNAKGAQARRRDRKTER